MAGDPRLVARDRRHRRRRTVGAGPGGATAKSAAQPAGHEGHQAAPTRSNQADGPPLPTVAFERYRRPDPTLPAVPPGRVKRFRVDVFEHVTRVLRDAPPIRVWSYGVNGVFLRGTGASAPMVVNQGDT